MMPEWHQLDPMSGHVEESETAKKKLKLNATLIFQVHFIVCQLDYQQTLLDQGPPHSASILSNSSYPIAKGSFEIPLDIKGI